MSQYEDFMERLESDLEPEIAEDLSLKACKAVAITTSREALFFPRKRKSSSGWSLQLKDTCSSAVLRIMEVPGITGSAARWKQISRRQASARSWISWTRGCFPAVDRHGESRMPAEHGKFWHSTRAEERICSAVIWKARSLRALISVSLSGSACRLTGCICLNTGDENRSFAPGNSENSGPGRAA